MIIAKLQKSVQTINFAVDNRIMKDLRSVADNNRNRSLAYYIISGVMIIYVLYGLTIYWFNRSFIYPDPLMSWQITEWLINYEGGFVRRGLLGEGLFKLCGYLGIAPLLLLVSFTLCLYLSLFVFYLKKFRERGLYWWFLCGPLMFGYLDDVMRKDFLMIWILVITILLLKNKGVSKPVQIVTCLITTFGLLVHEAYIFFGAPIAFLLLRGNGSKAIAFILAVICIAEFGLLSFYRGSLEVATGIADSWNNLLGKYAIQPEGDHSIGALVWNIDSTFRYHTRSNIGADYYCTGFLLQIINALSVYYVTINFMKVFQRHQDGFTEEDQTNIGALFMILAITMLPMFTLLSCDYGRLYQYEVMSIVGAYLILDKSSLSALIPASIRSVSYKLNRILNSTFTPSPAWTLFLFMVIGTHTGAFNIAAIFNNSVLGKMSILIGWLIQSILF